MEEKDLLEEIRLPVNISRGKIKEIKMRALVQDKSMKDWVEEAIDQKIRTEIELGFK